MGLFSWNRRWWSEEEQNQFSRKMPPLASGASGKAEDTRSQQRNKKLAFARMAASKEFQAWARIEACRVTGKLAQIEEWVDREMRVNLKVEKKDENGRWVEWNSGESEIWSEQSGITK